MLAMPLASPLAASLPAIALALAGACRPGASPRPRPRAAAAERENFAGRLEFDGTSDFSHIRIRRRGDVRSMLFVRDTGEEVLETQINLRQPHVLQFEYLKFLFASYLFRDPQQDVLIVGLGGGGMVHFLRHVRSGGADRRGRDRPGGREAGRRVLRRAERREREHRHGRRPEVHRRDARSSTT